MKVQLLLKPKVKLLILLSIMMLMLSCDNASFSTEYGIQSLRLSDGREIYIKRMVWGLNGNSDVLVISPNKDHCHMADPKTDYIFHSVDSGWFGFYYKVEVDTLVLFVWSDATLPESGQFPIKIVQNQLNPTEYYEMERNAAKLGLHQMKVDLDKSLKCEG